METPVYYGDFKFYFLHVFVISSCLDIRGQSYPKPQLKYKGPRST